MKKTLFFFSILGLIFITTSFSSYGQKADFSGNWAIDRSKIATTDNQLILVKINIKTKGDSLLTVRVYETSDGQQYPFNENVSLDGKENKITIYDMPRKAKASWSAQDASLIFESTTTFNGDSGPANLVTKETWKLDPSKNGLSIESKNTLPQGETTGTFFFKRVTN